MQSYYPYCRAYCRLKYMTFFFPYFFLSSSTTCWLGCSLRRPRPITFYELALLLVICPFKKIRWNYNNSYILVFYLTHLQMTRLKCFMFYMIWKIWKKSKLNSEMIWKIWKKIVKRYEKYGRKLWNDMENTEEISEKIWKIWKKDKLNSE